jgi:integrase/recombinase XerD
MRTYTKIISPFVAWLETQGVTSPQEVTARLVRQYLATYADKSDWYLNGIARVIRTLVRFWYKEGYLPAPIIFDMPKVRQKQQPFLTAEQVQKILNVCDLRQKSIVLLFVDSGMRRREVCNLNRSDVDLKTGIVRVRQGKGRKDRITVIGATTRRILLKYWQTCTNKDDDAPAVQTETGERFTIYGMSSFLHRLSEKSGVRFSAHALRRTFATLSLKAGMDIVSLQSLLGHADIGTTRQYIQWLDNDILKAHQLYSPVENLKNRTK